MIQKRNMGVESNVFFHLIFLLFWEEKEGRGPCLPGGKGGGGAEERCNIEEKGPPIEEKDGRWKAIYFSLYFLSSISLITFSPYFLVLFLSSLIFCLDEKRK